MSRTTENQRQKLTTRQIKDLIKNLNKLCRKLDEKYKINEGGCCYLAYKIFKGLKSLGIKPSLVICNFCGELPSADDYYEVVKARDDSYFLNGNNCFNHYFVDIPNIGMINNGYEGDNVEFIENLSASDILYIYRNSDWNDTYKVSNNRHVSKILNQFFKDVLQKL